MAKTQSKLLASITNENHELNYILTATTNKASRVIGKVTDMDATTIHSFLGLRVENDYKTGRTFLRKTKDYKVIQNTLVIIDECGMIDSDLKKVIEESTCNCKVLYIGDGSQLNPVFESQSPVFKGGYLTKDLTTIQRQAAGNPIIQLAQQLRETVETGIFKPIQSSAPEIIFVNGDEFKEMVDKDFPNYEEDKFKILAWSNEKVNMYNDYIRKLIHNVTSNEPFVGERLITNSLVKGIYQGQAIGNEIEVTVHSINDETSEYYGIEYYTVLLTNGITIRMPVDYKEVTRILKFYAKEKSWVDYFQCKEAFADVRPAYASTIHKSQGSTYEKVFIDLEDIGRCNKPDDVARLLYVAVTRASKEVVFYGKLPSKYGG
jgi:ATP-dependent exoDNAse (exonuclease V) alpha subunit